MRIIFLLICVLTFNAQAQGTPTPQERLYQAACSTDITGALAALKDGASPSIHTKHGDFPLGCAAQSFGQNRVKMIDLLLSAGADINAQTPGGQSALIAVVDHYMTWDPDVVQLLLNKGANPDLITNEGKTALHYASGDERKIEIVKLLVSAHANLNILDHNGYTPLIAAIAFKLNEVAKALLTGKPDLEVYSSKRLITALDMAAMNGNKEMVNLLLKDGAKIETENRSALFKLAAEHSSSNVHTVEVAKILIDAGAEIDFVGDHYDTPLIAAIGNYKTSLGLVKLLIESGADLNRQDSYGMTALVVAASGYFDKTDEIIAELLKAGAKVNIQDFKGQTALMFAHSVELFQLYIKHGALLDLLDSDGNTALMRRAKILSFVKVLVEAGADVNVRNRAGETALRLCYDSEIRAYLIQHGAVW